MPIKGFEAEYETALSMIEASASEAPVYFDAFLGTRSHMPIYMLLPEWAQTANLETMYAQIGKPGARERLIEHFEKFKEAELTVSVADGVPYLEGKTLQEFQENRALGAGEALYELMRLTKLYATVLYQNIDAHLYEKAITHPRSFIASNWTSFAPTKPQNERTHTFPTFLSLALKKKLLTLEGAIKKITHDPAEFLGLKDRGIIKEDKIADLALFSVGSASEVIIEHTIVNGVLAVHNRTLSDVAHGEILLAAS
jgi:N-acyl-D-amino-acid deacylase